MNTRRVPLKLSQWPMTITEFDTNKAHATTDISKAIRSLILTELPADICSGQQHSHKIHMQNKCENTRDSPHLLQ